MSLLFGTDRTMASGPVAQLQSLHDRPVARATVRRVRTSRAHAQGAVAPRVPRGAAGTPGQEGRAPRRDLARHVRRRRRAEGLHPRDPARAGRRRARAAVHRDGAPARLPLRRRMSRQSPAPPERAAVRAAGRDRRASMLGPVQYARSGDVNIAYQVCGNGPIDLVFVMGWVSHLEYFWKEPSFARFLSAPRVVLAADPVRQARHRPVGSGDATCRRSNSAWTTCARCWTRSARAARCCSACPKAARCAACSRRRIRARPKR